MRSTSWKQYAPFIALAALQASFAVFAPSRGEDTGQALSTFDPGSPLAGGTGFDPAASDGGGSGTVAAGGFQPGASAAGAGGGAATGGSGGAGGGASAGGGGGGATGGQTGVPASGDTSHCTADGRQSDVIYNAPACQPAWPEGADNGGATYPGVTADEIKLVYFECQPNEQVNAILATQGLAASREELDAMVQAAVDWMNETYEFYGRTLVWEHVIGDCPLTPPDPARNRQAAQEVADTHPMFVTHYASGPSTHDVWARNGVVSLGAPGQDVSFLSGRRPFRWDVYIDGTQSAEIVAEYYCKKLAGGAADHAGALIHASIGGRATPRRLGIIVPDNGTGSTVPIAQHLQRLVGECSGGQDVPLFTYASDINRATEQSRAIIAGLIDAKVTTVACMCDAIAPVFFTQTMTQNNYFPEHLLPGLNLLDYDKLGRLYDTAQWTHAFGPSHLVNPVPFDDSDAARIWRAAGRSGRPCPSCNLVTGYINLVGHMIQNAGPNLNPLTVERGMLTAAPRGGWDQTGGDPHQYLIAFGEGDYTAISDYREVYWDPAARSEIDGNAGAYLPIDGGRRYRLGQLGGGLSVPAKPQ